MQRRTFLTGLGAAGLAGWAATRSRFWPHDGLRQDCATGPTPAALLQHELVAACWEGLDPAECWDCHIHLIGVGDNGSGIWINPRMQQWWHPIEFAQFHFYLNGSCADHAQDRDGRYLQRLSQLLMEFPPGFRCMLLAFDYHYDELGHRQLQHSAFHTPDVYAGRMALQQPERLEWIASIHPYRDDALDALRQAAALGARAVKWLPAAMGMHPGSPRCDAFYALLRALDMPLLVHCGTEYAVHGAGVQELGNPLHLRRPLEQGVRVLVAHCASLGRGVDLDRGANGPRVPNFELFARLMDEPVHVGRLFGEISAVTQINRRDSVIDTLLTRKEWHPRLVNGSDYPLPGIVPVFSPTHFARRGLLSAEQADVLRAIRLHNPLLFDFLLKRMLRRHGQGFANAVFMTCRHFVQA